MNSITDTKGMSVTNKPNLIQHCLFVSSGDSLSSLQKAVEQKETSRQQLREQLDAVERETRAKLLEIDAFNTQLKVNSQLINTLIHNTRERSRVYLCNNID